MISFIRTTTFFVFMVVKACADNAVLALLRMCLVFSAVLSVDGLTSFAKYILSNVNLFFIFFRSISISEKLFRLVLLSVNRKCNCFVRYCKNMPIFSQLYSFLFSADGFPEYAFSPFWEKPPPPAEKY